MAEFNSFLVNIRQPVNQPDHGAPHSRPFFGLEWGFHSYNRTVAVTTENPRSSFA